VQRKLGERLGELGSADAAVVKRALILVADELRKLSTLGRRSAAWLDAAPTNAHSLGERVGKALLASVDVAAAKTSDDHVLATLRSATAALQESRKGAAVALTTDADRLAGEKERALAEATEQAARLAASLEERVGGCMEAQEATVRSFSLEVAHLESALAALAAEEGRRRAALGRLEEARASANDSVGKRMADSLAELGRASASSPEALALRRSRARLRQAMLERSIGTNRRVVVEVERARASVEAATRLISEAKAEQRRRVARALALASAVEEVRSALLPRCGADARFGPD